MKLNDELTLLLLDTKQPRRKRLLENLLVGKKTVATIYWSLRYQLLGYLGLGRYLGIIKLDFGNLVKQHLVQSKDNQTYTLTERGLKLKTKFLKQHSLFNWQHNFQKINFMKFKARILLFIQVISEYQHHQRKYYPVDVPDSEMNFVKNYFNKIDKATVSHILKKELFEFLGGIKNKQSADLFANELVGFQNNGKTLFQLSSEFDEPLISVYLDDLEMISKLIDFIKNNQSNSILAPLLNGLKRPIISESALLTLKQYLVSHNLVKVAKIRHLKESTISEHLLEVAIYFPLNKFPYTDFINLELIEKLKGQLGNQIDDWKYEDLTLKDVSFFQFRLTEIYLTKLEVGE